VKCSVWSNEQACALVNTNQNIVTSSTSLDRTTPRAIVEFGVYNSILTIVELALFPRNQNITASIKNNVRVPCLLVSSVGNVTV